MANHYINIEQRLYSNKELSITDKFVLAYIVSIYRSTANFYMSDQKLAENLGTTVRIIRYSIDKLKRYDWFITKTGTRINEAKQYTGKCRNIIIDLNKLNHFLTTGVEEITPNESLDATPGMTTNVEPVIEGSDIDRSLNPTPVATNKQEPIIKMEPIETLNSCTVIRRTPKSESGLTLYKLMNEYSKRFFCRELIIIPESEFYGKLMNAFKLRNMDVSITNIDYMLYMSFDINSWAMGLGTFFKQAFNNQERLGREEIGAERAYWNKFFRKLNGDDKFLDVIERFIDSGKLKMNKIDGMSRLARRPKLELLEAADPFMN